MLSPTMAPAAATATTGTIASLPWLASRAAAISVVSPGTGTPLDSAPTSTNSAG